MFYLLMPSLDVRTSFHCTSEGTRRVHGLHYLPLHLSDMGRSFGGAKAIVQSQSG